MEITFLPQNKVVPATCGETLLDAARTAFIDLESSCNGRGTCGKCRVVHIDGAASGLHEDERLHLDPAELEAGVRLACRCEVEGPATFRVIDDARKKHRILADGFVPDFEFDPYVKKQFVEVPQASLENNRDHLKRLEQACGRFLTARQIDPALLRRLHRVFAEGGGRVTLVFAGDEWVGIEPGDTSGSCFGVAVDIGTTTVVASLVDLTTGEELASASMINPQKGFGLDVLSRIHHLKEHPDALEELAGLVRKGIDELIVELCESTGTDRHFIYEIAVAANATMTHLFLGIDATPLGSSPYAPVFTSDVEVPAKALGLHIAESGRVYCLPSVSSYVGADIVAGLITAELHTSKEKSLLIDIGTNGEIVLGSEEGLFACSCAAGPAFEGMNIRCGMRAADGAIEKVYIDEDVTLTTIGDRSPVGLCGSGVIDAVAELVNVGAIARSGRLAPTKENAEKQWSSKLVSGNGAASNKFILQEANGSHGEVAITQKDVRQVQLAKGAIRSGVVALAHQLGIDLSGVERVFVAGAFGHHVRMESLARLGMLPKSCLDRVELIGNSSKTGAFLCLLSKAKRAEARELAERVSYVELSCYPDYDRLFTECLAFSE